mmetsp:Transcript_22084/g.52986  ORF Transcript_22084/g.52986 Transcript_22084/m.52986 type:complete len:310 (+) Transcript_22084:182-1111(+)
MVVLGGGGFFWARYPCSRLVRGVDVLSRHGLRRREVHLLRRGAVEDRHSHRLHLVHRNHAQLLLGPREHPRRDVLHRPRGGPVLRRLLEGKIRRVRVPRRGVGVDETGPAEPLSARRASQEAREADEVEPEHVGRVRDEGVDEEGEGRGEERAEEVVPLVQVLVPRVGRAVANRAGGVLGVPLVADPVRSDDDDGREDRQHVRRLREHGPPLRVVEEASDDDRDERAGREHVGGEEDGEDARVAQRRDHDRDHDERSEDAGVLDRPAGEEIGGERAGDPRDKGVDGRLVHDGRQNKDEKLDPGRDGRGG